ncbi:hypothetical protein [Streptomyces sp. NPDC096311]|uniref:hypothetical protein n=1 Tax=Streptomyces sp. NPDC096311 TaxID=3366083 RepID=UPI0037FC81DC
MTTQPVRGDHEPVAMNGTIALENLSAQTDGLSSRVQRAGFADPFAFAQQAALVGLLALRGHLLGRVTDYEQAAQLAERLMRDAPGDSIALLPQPARGRPCTASPKPWPTSTPRVEPAPGRPPWTGNGRQPCRRSAVSPKPSPCSGKQPSTRPTSRCWELWPCSRRSGARPPSRSTCSTRPGAGCRDTPPTGHLAEVELLLGDPESAVARPRPLAQPSDDPEYASPLALALRAADRHQEAQPWRDRAAERSDELVLRHTEAYADHAADFWLMPHVGGVSRSAPGAQP